jgi:hypothetical protein
MKTDGIAGTSSGIATVKLATGVSVHNSGVRNLIAFFKYFSTPC